MIGPRAAYFAVSLGLGCDIIPLGPVQGDPSPCAKPPVDFKSKVMFWLALPWPGQRATLLFKATGGFAQGDGSPSTVLI